MNRKILRYFLVSAILLIAVQVGLGDDGSTDSSELFDMSLEELMNIEVDGTSTLTRTTRRLQPSSVTTITKEDIRSSGARSLDELLDIYVPNLQLIRDSWEFQSIGMRGIITDKNNKFLLLVNGREMNEHTEHGAFSERDLPMLTDIHHIDVVRGPGSCLYGPGAISMVINIVTETAATFQGSEVTTRLGHIEEFYSTEYKYGHQFEDGSGLFLFAGVSKYPGSDPSDSPVNYGFPYTYNNQYVPNDQAGWRDPKTKLHFNYTKDNMDFWVRYTRGGMKNIPPPYFEPTLDNGSGYQQISTQLQWTQSMADTFKLKYTLSYDTFDYEQHLVWRVLSHREDEYLGKVVAEWNPSDAHSVALGVSASHEKFGKSSPDYPDEVPQTAWIYWSRMPQWSTTTVSGFFEHQWKIKDKLTSFIGGRVDDHTYTDRMFSPRAALIYTPTQKDTLKLMYSRSVRMGMGDEMHFSNQETGQLTDPEKLDAFEFRYERQQTSNLWLAGSVFYHKYEMAGYDDVSFLSNVLLGTMKTWGAEIEAVYSIDKFKLSVSHGYVKLIEFDDDPAYFQLYTSEPYGYGNDLANWHNHTTKLTARYQAAENLSIDGSIRIYWGSPGSEWLMRERMDTWGTGVTTPHSLYTESIFLNLGLTWNISQNTDLRIDGYNLMGLFDKKLNQRLYAVSPMTETRSAAPALGITLHHRF